MKKILTMSALLLAALLLFTACPSEPDPNGNGLPGTWVSSVNLQETGAIFFNDAGSFSKTGNNQFTATLNAGALTGNNIPSSGSFLYDSYFVTSDSDYKGFKATVTSTSGSYYGFFFNCNYSSSTNTWSFYSLILNNQRFLLLKKQNNTLSEVATWTTNTAINTAPAENEIVVYNDIDGSSIVIKINGTTVYTISNADFTSGSCGILGCASDVDKNNNRTITSIYTFQQFQR